MTNREYGMAALNLQMTDHVPRMEYSVLMHEDLIRRVTGCGTVDDDAKRLFMKKWDICMAWNTMANRTHLGTCRSSMGHAVYEKDGADKDTNVFSFFEEPEEVFAFDPLTQLPSYTEEELIGMFDRHYDAKERFAPDVVNMTGTYITGMSGLIEMLGWDMLLTCAGEDADAFGAFFTRYSLWIEKFFIALAKCKAPVVMIHDDIVWTEGPFMQPAWYRRYLFPAYERLFSHLHGTDKKIMFTSDGNYTAFIDDIAACGIDSFVLEPTTDMAVIAGKYGKTHGFVGNADTRILLTGDREAIRREVARCMDIGRDCPGFIMAVGNHIPPNTPVDACLWYDEFCRELGRRA